MKYTAISIAVVFALAGVTVACTDLRDHFTVDPTPAPSGVDVAVPSEPETINQAWRSVEDFRYAANTYIERRNEDIAKQEQKVAFIEGFGSAGLAAISESAGTWAGPFAPLLTLGLGYLVKRRNDKTPDEYRKAKEDSYNKGLEFGKALADATRNQNQES